MSTATAPMPAGRSAGRSGWFHSPAFDLLFVLAVPAVTWPLVMLGQGELGAGRLNLLIALTATGHYCATFVRAYGDRELFARFRVRFLLVPAALLVGFLALFHAGHGAAVQLVVSAWAFWHWLAQAFGFARIYDIKAGCHDRTSAWLDRALVIVGFVSAVTLNPGSVATFAKLFLDAGYALPDAERFAVVQDTVLVAVAVTATLYLLHLGRCLALRRPWSWQKQLMHVTTIGYYWFSFAWLDNVLVAYVLYELFHDIQYYAITWLTCRQRATRAGTTGWFRAMFAGGAGGTLLFLGVMTGFGALDFAGRPHANTGLAVFLTLAVLHYYYDGFIWKAREQSLGRDLGIGSGLLPAMVPGLRHAARWSLFVAPLGFVLATGGPSVAERTRSEQLAALVPGDFLAQTQFAFELAKAGELDRALVHYRASVDAHPNYSESRVNFGSTLELKGDLDGAREQYRAALDCPDQGMAHATAALHLGVLELVRGDRPAAEAMLQRARSLGGGDPIRRMLELAAAIPAQDLDRQRGYWTAALQLDANLPDAHFGLGTAALQRRRFDLALLHLTALRKLAPQYVPGLVALATAQAESGKFDDARATVQQVLGLEPANATALALQRRLEGR
ncbi:MAG: tetratricopeptide repeat protein [Planctomycetes bacterium]|nr:tetratricopeptide repeat protein [Planctomycetota bacterium]